MKDLLQLSIEDNIQLDASGKATNMPPNWYDYGNKKWANIVTENNGKNSLLDICSKI